MLYIVAQTKNLHKLFRLHNDNFNNNDLTILFTKLG